MRHYKKFHNSIAAINDSIIYHTFCSKQVSLEVERYKADCENASSLNEVTIRKIFNKNDVSHRYNKKLEGISGNMNDADAFIYDNSLILIYLQIEIFAKEFYASIQKTEKMFRSKMYDLELDKFKYIQPNLLESLDQKLENLKESYLKNGVQLSATKRNIPVRSENDESKPLLIDLNTNQIVTSVLSNLGIIERGDLEDVIQVGSSWKEIISAQDIPLQLYLDTLEYFRLMRNVIAHRKLGERSNGSFGYFISEKGKRLNEGWDSLYPKKRIIDFTASKNLSFTSHLEIIEAIVLLRKVVSALDALLRQVFSNQELVKYHYWEFIEMRENDNKGRINISCHFDRFYAKFEGFLKEKSIQIGLNKAEVKTVLLDMGE